MKVGQKIRWRLELLNKALYSWSEADWIGVFKEILSSHSKAKSYPQPRLLDREGDLGLYQVGTRRVFFPLAFDPSFLGLVYDEVFVHCIYEHGECRVRPGDWVMDAGACEGFFSLYALEKGANVLAFEPVPELVRALERNLAEFINAGRARIFPFALGKEEGEKTLHIYYYNVGRSTMSREVQNDRGDSADVVRKEKVLVTSLDKLLAEGLLPLSLSSKPMWKVMSVNFFWEQKRPSVATIHGCPSALITFLMTGVCFEILSRALGPSTE